MFFFGQWLSKCVRTNVGDEVGDIVLVNVCFCCKVGDVFLVFVGTGFLKQLWGPHPVFKALVGKFHDCVQPGCNMFVVHYEV